MDIFLFVVSMLTFLLSLYFFPYEPGLKIAIALAVYSVHIMLMAIFVHVWERDRQG